MSATETTSFKDYDLVCGARIADHGMFAPTLVVPAEPGPAGPASSL